MRILRYAASVLRRALRNLVEQRRLHVLAISVMALSLSVLGTFVVVASNLARVRGELGSEQHLTSFLAAGISPEQQAVLRDQVLQLAGVASVELLDPTQAAERFRQALGPHGAILDEVGDDVIPAALVVTAVDGSTVAGVEEIARRLSSLAGIEEVAYAQEEIQRLSALIRIIEIAALAIGGLIALVTIIVVSNTIRLTVMAREEEIAIMKLVGATDSYVRLPFVVEGFLGGLVAGMASVLIVSALDLALAQALAPVASGAFVQFDLANLGLRHALMLVACGAGVGLVGGLVSVGRFLRDSS
ncbi:MAG: permease-like cell division protein FtsX [Pseudomonadota bacterium]